MRDVNRLYKIYDVLFESHKKIPDIRFMQLMSNFFDWHKIQYGTDGFYVEDDEFIIRFKKYMGMFENSVYY